MENLDRVREVVAAEHGLAVVSTVRDDGTVQASVVNAGVLAHPVTGQPVVGFVVRGDTRKLRHLRRRPQTTVVFRVGWEWIAIEGLADLVGPADPLVGIEANEIPQLLRDIFTAAGGTHDDWDEYDRVMAAEGRTAVLVVPRRVYSNSSLGP